MNRFFCLRTGISDQEIALSDKEQVHHIKNVLKLEIGEKVGVFDETGNEYHCAIIEIKDKVYLRIEGILPRKDSKIKLTIACAIPKKAKIDDIIDKLIQLGADRIIPLKSERVVVKLDKQKENARLERWKKIALSATKQSQRSQLPEITPIKSLKEVIALSSEFDLRLIPTLRGERRPLEEIFSGDNSIFRNKKHESVTIIALIGPEGDFSDAEVNAAIIAGFIPVTLGDLVLRVDTAAIAVAAYIKLKTFNPNA